MGKGGNPTPKEERINQTKLRSSFATSNSSHALSGELTLKVQPYFH